MNLCAIITRFEGGDVHWKLLVTCSQQGVELQEGGGIARNWIADPKVYPGIPVPQ